MIIGQDFVIRDDISTGEDKTLAIELKLHPFTGVVYNYTVVRVKELENEQTAILQFEFNLVDTKEFSEARLRNDSRFQEILGLILNRIILEVVEKDTGPNAGENDTQELVEE